MYCVLTLLYIQYYVLCIYSMYIYVLYKLPSQRLASFISSPGKSLYLGQASFGRNISDTYLLTILCGSGRNEPSGLRIRKCGTDRPFSEVSRARHSGMARTGCRFSSQSPRLAYFFLTEVINFFFLKENVVTRAKESRWITYISYKYIPCRCFPRFLHRCLDTMYVT